MMSRARSSRLSAHPRFNAKVTSGISSVCVELARLGNVAGADVRPGTLGLSVS
jgi:hypothetical protein